ncbi:MAG TPA: hypothetical protein VJ464_11820 [Blastocatellia bacterium]|nr:hypothetical protein [Blastocatellia bacterium]
MNRKGVLSIILAAGLMLMSLAPDALAGSHRHHHKRHHHHSAAKKIASIGAPIAIGMAFGPAGSVGYQVVKHRRAIKHHLIHH